MNVIQSLKHMGLDVLKTPEQQGRAPRSMLS